MFESFSDDDISYDELYVPETLDDCMDEQVKAEIVSPFLVGWDTDEEPAEKRTVEDMHILDDNDGDDISATHVIAIVRGR